MHLQPRQLTGTSVLLVEDERDVRETIAAGLTWQGANVYAADSAEAGWRMFGQARPCVIVADLGLPGADGFQFLRQIRSLPKSEGGATPAVALTARNTVTDRVNSLKAGFTLHLAKPVDPLALATLLAALLET
jgi:CheY-like chemotaxis protein